MKRQVSVSCHRWLVTWQSFNVAEADAPSNRGFTLIGQLVRRRRHRLGISQLQLELLSGVDQTVISRLENGRLGGLRWSRFARLVDALGGLGDVDPMPAWTARYLPRGDDRGTGPRAH